MKTGNIKLGLVLFSLLLFNISNAQLCILSDDFEGDTLNSEWQQYGTAYYDLLFDGEQLTMDINNANCSSNCPWYHSESAGFVYKNIVGDFELISVVHAEEASGANAGDDISNDTQLGGLMARNGNSDTENYVFNVVGSRFDNPSIETKSTTNNNSNPIHAFLVATTRSELRMVRSGSVFYMYSRIIGAPTWTLRSTFNRPDLPDTLQVGMIAYAFSSYPQDLAVQFDFIEFSEHTMINSWLGGNGMWSDNTMWSLNVVPDSTHNVIINNSEAQTIQILQNEIFNCYSLDILDNQSQLNIEGQLNVVISTTGCD